jgi:very-short-patch-repair endonuclease
MPDLLDSLSLPLASLPIIAGLILLVLLVLLAWKAFISRGLEYPYLKKEALFSSAERSFLGVLDQAVGQEYRIFGKVRLADVLSVRPTSDRKAWWRAFNKVSAKHVDFLLCGLQDLSIQAPIELDDISHGQQQRQSRDAFLTKACQAAGLPLIRIPARQGYSVAQLREVLSEVLTLPQPPQQQTEAEQAADKSIPQTENAQQPPACPKCSATMVRRRVKSGPKAGLQFWGCSRYPECRGVVKIG